MTIWKYTLVVDDVQTITVPHGSKPLHLATQQGTPCLWMMCDPSQPFEKRTVRTYGTGHPVDSESRQYVGSYLIHNDMLVFHVFLEDPA